MRGGKLNIEPRGIRSETMLTLFPNQKNELSLVRGPNENLIIRLDLLFFERKKRLMLVVLSVFVSGPLNPIDT